MNHTENHINKHANQSVSARTPINTMVAWRPFKRPLASLVIFAQLALVLQPLSAVAQDNGRPNISPLAQSQLNRIHLLSRDIEAAKAQKLKDSASPADKASADLVRIEEITKTLHADLHARGLATLPTKVIPGQGQGADKDAKQLRALGPDMRIEAQRSPEQNAPLRLADSQRQEKFTELKNLLSRQQTAQAAISAEFQATRTELEQKKLPAEILARHDANASQFEQRASAFNAIAQRVTNNQNGAVEELNAFFTQYPNSKRALPVVDAKKLPWSAPEPTQRIPAETKTAWYNNLYRDHNERQASYWAQAGGSIGGIHFTQMPEPSAAPTEADLAETDEIQLTAAIRAKAAELGRNPVNIHNWVRNNTEWAPTWGAIQSAQDTMDKRRGNAMDIASLEIALLRAAGIPARYQLGTIEVGAQQLQNWVGGANKAEAAQQIIAQGGIANRGLVEGGRIAKVRMEHVWVQAYVNWAPSRGHRNAGSAQNPAQHVNPNAALNAWVALDASYKQYNYSAGMDLKTAVPLDATALLNAAQQGATVNTEQGWVQSLNQAAIQSQLTDYQARLKAYIDSTATGTSSTVGDVIGKQIIPQQVNELLAGTLPYVVVQTGSQSAAVPASLQHQFTYQLSTGGWDNTPILSYTEKLSKLVGKRLTISYIPATQADADLIASYLPKPHADGSPILPSELPTSLPGYLIHLKAQINLDGVAVATSATALPMGTDLQSTGGFTQLGNPTQWDLTSESSNTVGQATAIGISAGGISATQLTQLKDRLTKTKTQLEAKNFTGLTGEQISGDLLTATIWSWFAAAESHNRLSQGQAGMIENQGLSYGLFHAIAQPAYSWGVIRKVSFPGVNLDIGHVRPIGWSKDNDRNTWIAYNKLRGQYMSALEHAIPERFFNDPTKCNPEGTSTPVAGLPSCPQGISAVKAIGIAASQGQKIYTITREVYARNPNIVSSDLSAHSLSTRQGIQNALNAGMEVTVHEAPIAQSGWTGSGYTFIDPQTGAGGYIIDGGSNGGVLNFVGTNSDALGFTFFVLGLFATLATSLVIPLLVAISALIFGIVALMAAHLEALESAQCPSAVICINQIFGLMFAIGLIFAIIGLFASPVAGLVLGLLGLIFSDNFAKASSNGCNGVSCR